MKKLLILPLAIFFTYSANAQLRGVYGSGNGFSQNLEIVGGLGVINFLGELGGSPDIGSDFVRDLEMRATRPTIHLGLRYLAGSRYSHKIEMTMGWLRGDDKWTTQENRNDRNLNFRSPLFEFGTRSEFYFLPDQNENRYKIKGIRGRRSRPFFGYAFVGVSGFLFNPKGQDADGNWVALQPLRTEGQGVLDSRDPYRRIGLAIPFGISLNYKVNRELNIGIDDVSLTYVDGDLLRTFNGELSAKMADKSLGTIPGATSPGQQRGNPRDDDHYVFLLITANYKFNSFKQALPKFR
jgi:hypothetical protein